VFLGVRRATRKTGSSGYGSLFHALFGHCHAYNVGMIYLDNAATSFPKPESVYLALDHTARHALANPGRTSHRMALAAEHLIKECRHRLNQLFHGADADRVVLTLNCTDALNIAFKGVLNSGDHVITTDLEHNSVSRPLRALELAGDITLTRISADSGGTIDPAAVRKAITPKTRLLAVTHASNVLGTVQPVGDFGALARSNGAMLLVDAAQTAGVVPIDVQAMGIDLLAVPGHKGLLGPTGTGALYVRPGIDIRPWREGGTGGDSTSETQPREWPFYLEGGTPNVLGIAGLLAGLQYLHERGPDAIRSHETALVERLWNRLEQLPAVTIYGHRDFANRVGTLSFNVEGMASTDVGNILDTTFDIAIRPGMHCAPFIHKALGTSPEGAVRVSPGPFSSEGHIDQLADALTEITS
jgi:cysteine desulfurase family protein